jgi:uncharacterized protein YbaP (TraB family)
MRRLGAADRIERDARARAAGEFEHLLRERGAAARDHVRRAGLAQRLALGFAACERDRHGAHPVGDLNCGEAHAARRRAYQHGVAFAQTADFDQRAPCRGVHHPRGGGFLEREAFRVLHDGMHGRVDEFAIHANLHGLQTIHGHSPASRCKALLRMCGGAQRETLRKGYVTRRLYPEAVPKMINTDRITETLLCAARAYVAVCAGLCATLSGAHAAPIAATPPAQTEAGAPLQAAAPAFHPPVWTASSPGHPTLLLLPTIHALASDDPRIDAALAEWVNGVRAIVLEANMHPTREDVQTMFRYGMYPVADNLSNHVRLMTAESLARCARESGFDVRLFFQHKPWLAGFAVEAVRLHEYRWKDGAKGRHFVATGAPSVVPGIDARLAAIAGRRQIPLIYLETMEQGMRLLDDMPAADQEAFLQGECTGLHGKAVGEVSYADFQAAWAAGDVARLERLAMARHPGESAAHYDFSQYLFVRGTDIFAATMAKDGYFYGKGPILVAVGAGHFFGEHSLLQRLRDAGYTVSPPEPVVPAAPLAQPHVVAAR